MTGRRVDDGVSAAARRPHRHVAGDIDDGRESLS